MSVPALVGFVLITITSTGWTRVAFSVAAFTNAIAAVVWMKDTVRFLRRLKEPDKGEFLKLYYRLHDATAADNIVEIVVAIREMARIRGSSFKETSEFAFQKAGTFLPIGSKVPLRIPPMWMCTGVLKVLDADLDQLPKFLSHEYDYIRRAASLKLELLKPTNSR